MRSGRRAAARVLALVAFIIVILVARPQAQHASYSGAPGTVTAGLTPMASNVTAVDLLVGRSTVLNVAAPIARVSLTVPDIADAMVTSPQQLLIHGKTPGTISLFVWDRAGGITTYEVNVRRDLSQLVEQMKQLFPGEPIAVTGSGKDVVISGSVSSKYVIDKAADVAGGYVEKKENVVNLLKQVEGQASNQVMLRVRFAEVSRSALQELGASLFTGPTGYKDLVARSTTQQFAAPDFSELSRTGDSSGKLLSSSGKYSLSDFLNLFIFSNKYNVGTVIRALQDKGLFQSLAEPDLIASNGKEASFLAGGEYPYPIVQPGAAGSAITIMFKEFGIRLNFTPTVLGGDMVNLKVRPEVSALDFSNAITLQGFRVPALSTRRTETEVELADGQTFAIAGLLNNSVTDTLRKVPGIGDVPVLGYLFKSKAMQKQQTELVVMITPTILRRAATGVSSGLPNLVEPFLAPPSKSYPAPVPYTGSPVTPATRQPRTPGGKEQPDASSDSQGGTQPMPAAPLAAQPPAQGPGAPAAAAAQAPRVRPQPLSNQPGAAMAPSPNDAPAASSGSPAAAAAPMTVTPPTQPQPSTPTAPKVDTKAARKAAEAQRAAERKAAQEKAAADKRAADQKAAADKKAAEEKAAADKKAAEEKAAADKKAAEDQAAADKKAAEDKAAADKKAAEEKDRQQKLDAERAKREAEVARKAAEADRRKQDDEKKQNKAIADAAARLKAAQAAYQAELDKKKGIQ